MRRTDRAGIAWAMGALLVGWLVAHGSASVAFDARPHAALIPVTGPIGPATSDFLVRQLREAQEAGAQLVIVRIDTPGGLETSMRDMIRAILAADVAVVAYVAPSGARAASAGTFLMYASHVAAMAPATNLGAATPVAIGGAPRSSPVKPGAEPDETPQGPSQSRDTPRDASERKSINDAVAYLRGLAELRGRNADWAERAVRDGASLSAGAALTANVIDLIATDTQDLLQRLDGRVVKLATREARLATQGLVLREVAPGWRTQVLQIVTNPNVAYLLLLIGLYGLLLEGYSPGAVLPGVVGAISLLLALFAFQVLSVNYTGLALIALGVLLIIAEAFAPSFGALGLGGIVAFVFGSILLLDSEVPGFGVAWQLIGSMALVGALVLIAIVSFAVRARRRPVVGVRESLLRAPAIAVESFASRGLVRVHGELWQAVTDTPLQAGTRLRVVRVNGLELEVEPASD